MVSLRTIGRTFGLAWLVCAVAATSGCASHSRGEEGVATQAGARGDGCELPYRRADDFVHVAAAALEAMAEGAALQQAIESHHDKLRAAGAALFQVASVTIDEFTEASEETTVQGHDAMVDFALYTEKNSVGAGASPMGAVVEQRLTARIRWVPEPFAAPELPTSYAELLVAFTREVHEHEVTRSGKVPLLFGLMRAEMRWPVVLQLNERETSDDIRMEQLRHAVVHAMSGPGTDDFGAATQDMGALFSSWWTNAQRQPAHSGPFRMPGFGAFLYDRSGWRWDDQHSLYYIPDAAMDARDGTRGHLDDLGWFRDIVLPSPMGVEEHILRARRYYPAMDHALAAQYDTLVVGFGAGEDESR
jgi:hypothetical protein